MRADLIGPAQAALVSPDAHDFGATFLRAGPMVDGWLFWTTCKGEQQASFSPAEDRQEPITLLAKRQADRLVVWQGRKVVIVELLPRLVAAGTEVTLTPLGTA